MSLADYQKKKVPVLNQGSEGGCVCIHSQGSDERDEGEGLPPARLSVMEKKGINSGQQSRAGRACEPPTLPRSMVHQLSLGGGAQFVLPLPSSAQHTRALVGEGTRRNSPAAILKWC